MPPFVTVRPKDDEQRILPLINIVFLLLIYVLLAGQIALVDPFETRPPRSVSEGPAQPRQVVLYVSKDGQMALNSAVVTKTELPAALAESGAPATVRVKADRRASARQVVDITRLLGVAGVETIDLITLPD